jgi:hypothetical protein
LIQEYRTFFSALAFTRTHGRPVERVRCKTTSKLHAFSIALNGEDLNAWHPALRTPVQGRLPLAKFVIQNRIIAFKGKAEMFQGYDHETNEHFRIKVMGDVAEFFDYAENRPFFYRMEEELPAPESAVEPPASDATQ